MLANSRGCWGKQSKRFNNGGKPQAFDNRGKQKVHINFTHANLKVVIWNFKILPSIILTLYGEEEGWDPQEGVSVIFNTMMHDNRDGVAAAGRFLFTKSVWNNLLYCSDGSVHLKVVDAGKRAQVDFVINFYQSKTRLLGLVAPCRLQNVFYQLILKLSIFHANNMREFWGVFLAWVVNISRFSDNFYLHKCKCILVSQNF